MVGNPDTLQREREMGGAETVHYVDAQGNRDTIQTSGCRLIRGSDGMLMGTGNTDAARRIAAKLGELVE
jgi:hypothetical protein